MNKRQLKKINLKSMHILLQLDRGYYHDSFSIEDGLWCHWWICGEYGSEWDYESAFEQLQTYLINHLSKNDFVETGDDECPVELIYEFVPDVSTAKKALDLAKKLIERGVYEF